MAYVEWHDTVRNHPKTDALMLALGITRREAVGIIGMIVSWCILQKPSGYIEIPLLKVAVEWEKDEAQLVRALVGPKELQGPRLWLEDAGDGFAYILAWPEITKGFRKARRDAKRLKDKRRRAGKTSRDGSATVARRSSDDSATVAWNRAERSGTELSGAERGIPTPPAAEAPPSGIAAEVTDADLAGQTTGLVESDTAEARLFKLALKNRIDCNDKLDLLRSKIRSWLARFPQPSAVEALITNNPGKHVYELQRIVESGGESESAEAALKAWSKKKFGGGK